MHDRKVIFTRKGNQLYEGYGNKAYNQCIDSFNGNHPPCNYCPYFQYNNFCGMGNYMRAENIDEDSTPIALGEQKLMPGRFSVSYPIIPNDDNNKITSKINNAIIDEVSKLFRSQVLLPDVVDFNEVLGTYEVTVNKNGILSILFSMYTYVEGAAHGFTAYSSITVNVETGEIYCFSELFNPKINYTKFLNDLAFKYIKDNNIPLINEYNGITPDQQYYLTSDTLVLYYQVYEYTPYAYGLFKIEIPYSKITNLLTPFSPISKLLKFRGRFITLSK